MARLRTFEKNLAASGQRCAIFESSDRRRGFSTGGVRVRLYDCVRDEMLRRGMNVTNVSSDRAIQSKVDKLVKSRGFAGLKRKRRR